MGLQVPGKEIQIRAVRPKWEDIKKIFERLSQVVAEQADREIGQLRKPDEQSEEEFENYKEAARSRAFRITVTIQGPEPQRDFVFDDNISVFDSAHLPDQIASVHITNITAYRGFSGREPLAGFDLNLDFSKPNLMDTDDATSSPTPNFSRLSITGDRGAWIGSITDAVMGVLNKRKTNRAWLHRAYVYDVGFSIIALPLGFYSCWKLSGLIEAYFGSLHPILAAAGYIYVFFAALWVYRFLFGYTKWAFPTVELEENKDKAKKHRAALAVIALGIIANMIGELL